MHIPMIDTGCNSVYEYSHQDMNDKSRIPKYEKNAVR